MKIVERTIKEAPQKPPKPRNLPPRTLLDAVELASALKLAYGTVNRLAREGRIPSIVIGRQRRFDIEAVKATLSHDADTAGTVVTHYEEVSAGGEEQAVSNALNALCKRYPHRRLDGGFQVDFVEGRVYITHTQS